jgi:hypothetical protein
MFRIPGRKKRKGNLKKEGVGVGGHKPPAAPPAPNSIISL